MYLATNMGIVVLSVCTTAGATQVGVTHTQHSLDPWNDDQAVARGEELLSSGAIQFQARNSTISRQQC